MNPNQPTKWRNRPMPCPIRNKHSSLALIAPALFLAALVLTVSRAQAADAPTDNSAAAQNVFADAVAYAQARCVKLYGAGIGREHGYATGMIVSPDGKILCAQGIYLAGD